jgi:putative transposase
LWVHESTLVRGMRGVIAFARIVLQLLADVVALAVFSIRPRRSLEAENLVLRRQLGLFKARGVKPRRIDAATRVSLTLLTGLCDWPTRQACS